MKKSFVIKENALTKALGLKIGDEIPEELLTEMASPDSFVESKIVLPDIKENDVILISNTFIRPITHPEKRGNCEHCYVDDSIFTNNQAVKYAKRVLKSINKHTNKKTAMRVVGLNEEYIYGELICENGSPLFDKVLTAIPTYSKFNKTTKYWFVNSKGNIAQTFYGLNSKADEWRASSANMFECKEGAKYHKERYLGLSNCND